MANEAMEKLQVGGSVVSACVQYHNEPHGELRAR
jgi:hypothetical protein